jgi:predicted dehydrogenase
MKTSPTPRITRAGTRRSFIKNAAALSAAVAAHRILKTPVYGQTQAPSAGQVVGANNRIVMAYIGTGSQGMAHVRSQKEHAAENNIAQAAVCDVYQKRLDGARQYLGLSEADAVRDHRRILERKDIDAILVATVDNWHADVAVDALQAGKHVYGEKPLARYLDEGFRMYDAVKKSGKTFVVGSQYCVDAKYHKAAEWIRKGKLGPLVWAQGSYCRNNPKNSEWTYPVDKEASEANLDWTRWLGRARKIPFNAEHYFCWHKYYAYNSGILGNLLSHTFLPLLMATGQPEFPRRVVCTGTRKVSTDRDITDTTHLLAEMPSGLTFSVVGSTVNEQGLPEIIRGRKGTVYFAAGQGGAQFRPERPFVEEFDPEDFHDSAPVGSLSRLEKHFFDCIRSGATPEANIDLAIRAHTILSLAEMSERLSLTLLFDERTREVKTADGKVIPALTYDTVIPAGT